MVFIKDKITGKIKEFYCQYFKKGALMADTRNKEKIEQALNKDLYDCPQCGRHTMEEVFFAGSSSPDGEPGLLCFHCHYMLSGEELDGYMRDEDGWREE